MPLYYFVDHFSQSPNQGGTISPGVPDMLARTLARQKA